MTKLGDDVKTAEAADILGIAQYTPRAWSKARKVAFLRNPAHDQGT